MNRSLPPGDCGDRSFDPGRPSRRGRAVPGAGRLVGGIEADQGKDAAVVMHDAPKEKAHDGQ
jgi:hypothetical protein